MVSKENIILNPMLFAKHLFFEVTLNMFIAKHVYCQNSRGEFFAEVVLSSFRDFNIYVEVLRLGWKINKILQNR